MYAHGSTPKWIVQGWSLFYWGPHLEHFLHDEPMLKGTVPLVTHPENWYMATWKSVVITIRGLLQRGRLATSGNNSLEAKNFSLPWLKFEAVFPSLDPKHLDFVGNEKGPNFKTPKTFIFEGLRLTWCFCRLPNEASVSMPAPLSLHGALRCSQVRRPTWGRHPNLMNFLFLRNGFLWTCGS